MNTVMVWLSDHDLANLEAAVLCAQANILNDQHQEVPAFGELVDRLKAWRATGRAEALLASMPSYDHPVAGRALQEAREALASGTGRSLDVCREDIRHERVLCQIAGDREPGTTADQVNRLLDAISAALAAVSK